ncbi:hypothetical protein O6P43_010962 [Quillaja saponaria]|uniref:Uncharacterized protein n=1 Tax=Quillaja saponaria TaxID=32244 RepID=A0AAD7Q228_QUISA|nr:hypothetical protein O6P43_010962 [Quillaja saponaria]
MCLSVAGTCDSVCFVVFAAMWLSQIPLFLNLLRGASSIGLNLASVVCKSRCWKLELNNQNPPIMKLLLLM